MKPVRSSWPRRALPLLVLLIVVWGAWRLVFSKMHFVEDACLWYDSDRMVALGSSRRFVNDRARLFYVPFVPRQVDEAGSKPLEKLSVSFMKEPGVRERLLTGIDQPSFEGCRSRELDFGLNEREQSDASTCRLTRDFLYYDPITRDEINGAIRITCSKSSELLCIMTDYHATGWRANVIFPRQLLSEWVAISEEIRIFTQATRPNVEYGDET